MATNISNIQTGGNLTIVKYDYNAIRGGSVTINTGDFAVTKSKQYILSIFQSESSKITNSIQVKLNNSLLTPDVDLFSTNTYGHIQIYKFTPSASSNTLSVYVKATSSSYGASAGYSLISN